MGEELVLDLKATRHGLAEALKRIEHFSQSRNLTHAVLMRVLVIVEELFTNTIKYSYGGECDRPVRIALRAGEPLTLIYEDDGPAFDPTRWDGAPALDADPDSRPVGQAGIPLVLGLATAARYERRDGSNRLELELRS
jgi:anti-sigma regulatory factor (Ser/Thr protein kinase)